MNNEQRKEQAAKTFVEKATLKHQNKYNYSHVVYDGCKEKVEIECKTHGSFYQTPNGHLTGNGCPGCKKEIIKNVNALRVQQDSKIHLKTFLLKAKELHGNKYDYSEVVYKNRHTLVKITCESHGTYEQLPSNHLAGNGCPQCGIDGLTGGYHKDLFEMQPDLGTRLGYLYLAKIRDLQQTNSPPFLKVGITVQPPKYRLSRIKSNDFEIIDLDHVEGRLIDVFNAEQRILTEMKDLRFYPSRQFDGYTECFKLKASTKIQEHMILE